MEIFGLVPGWLHGLASASLAIATICAVIVAVDEIRRPQKMWIMNLIWPLTPPVGRRCWPAS